MASEENLRLAIIGCGAVVENHLVPALKRIGRTPSVLIDVAPERIEIVTRKIGAKGKTALKGRDWTAFRDEFDAAIVAVPNALHAPIGLDLIAAGKHVFMEKPLATKAEDCRRLAQAADDNKVVLSIGLLRRHLRIARWTKALLEQGTLGEIKSFDVREGYVFNREVGTDALLRPDLFGGGVLMDTGAHTIDLVTWWLGDLDVVSYKDDGDGGVEADCVLEGRLANGATGRIELTRTRRLRSTILITGTQGFVEVHLYRNEVFAGSDNALAFVHDGVSGTSMEPQFFPDLFDAELRDFKLACETGTRPIVTGWDGVSSVDVIERAYKVRQPLKSAWADKAASAAKSTGAARPSLPAGSRALITGASGFIGGRLAEILGEERGVKVRGLVRQFGHATRLARFGPEIVAADLTNAEQFHKAVEGVDYVFHCAHDMRSRTQNMQGLKNLIDACVRHKVKRLVYVSTFSVYEPFPDGRLSERTRDGDRNWAYVRDKLDMEDLVLKAVREQSLPASIVQPTIVYGPFSKPWTNAPAEDLVYGTVVLPDRGQGLCNAVYVDDLVDGLVLAASHPAAIGERFIISGPEPVAWGDFFGSFADALGTAPPQFWPKAQIEQSNQGLLREIKRVAKNPKRVVQLVLRWPPARRALQAGLDSLPEQLKGPVMKRYFTAGERRPGETILPDPQKLRLYSAKAQVDNEKAHRLLGYQPRYDFAAGMEPTGRYLEWAYGDLSGTIAAKAKALSQPPSQPKDKMVGHAGALNAG
ncbi:NAD-dependent epimerase/dehydratase family protein [Hyphomicrobium sp.]|uniref:NAD-dependent epimerase/dehydratase family protein n=1 Tax=Hyphomicrobium sp. TaxID=82 RepID=UPI0025C3EE1E|nr:NAD-dependent epimerase/dehydratase family protein [Hyphomicrobium sp.]MCC7250780.1 NAD-dependent epimerase/dehydratase family protein [Hyphomicrobium sp.]